LTREPALLVLHWAHQSASKAKIAAIRLLVRTQVGTIEKPVKLNGEVFKAAFEESVSNARTLGGASRGRQKSSLTLTLLTSIWV
jgi:hypothetical protein